jgi:hypothetical protein
MTRLPKPPPYNFEGELERKAAHDARFANARDNNGNQPTCPYCYQTAMVRGAKDGKRLVACGCPA